MNIIQLYSAAMLAAATPLYAGTAISQLAGGTGVAAVQEAPAPLVPFFPEDGSMPMKAWYTHGQPPAGVKAALAAEGVEPREIGFDYEWTQDITLFRADGTLALEASAPGRLLENLSLTTGVLNNEDGYPRLTAIEEADTASANLSYRRMQYTFVEGGGLITGAFADGAPYAITTNSPVTGAALIYEHRNGIKIDEPAARALVASDLGVDPSNLFIIPSAGHLDLIITPLRGGTLIVSDPSKTIATMEAVLARAPAAEKKRLKSMIKIYKEGWQSYPGAYRDFPVSEYQQGPLDLAAKILEPRFKVIRAAGVFKELHKYGNSDDLYIADRIDFFNGFTGSNAAGELFQVTNTANGLTSLEKYWTGLLAANGVARVYFPGSYASGAGLDCTGAPSAK